MSYEFSDEFQRDILRLTVNDPAFLFQFRRAIDPEYFTEPVHVTIAETILAIFDTSGEPPEVGLALETYGDYMDAGLDDMEVEDEIRALYADQLPRAAPEVVKKTVEFARHQALQALIADAPIYLKEGRFDDFETNVRECGMMGSDADGALYDYFDRMGDRLKFAQSRADAAVGTGIPSIDSHLPDGGITPGELMMFIGLPGYGKTTTMVNVGAYAVKKGYKVFHASVGDMDERKVGLRYDAHFTGQTIPWCRKHPTDARKLVEKVLQDTENVGGLKIHYWASGRATVADVERKLRWLKSHRAWAPDLIIVDYGANLRPRSGSNKLASWERCEEIYKDLRSMGSVLGGRVISGIQANREAFTAIREGRPIGQDNTAGSLGPMRDADVAIAIMMTKEERDSGIIRYHGAKVRDGDAEWIETCAVNFPTHTIIPCDDFQDDPTPDVRPPARRRAG